MEDLILDMAKGVKDTEILFRYEFSLRRLPRDNENSED